ncbi:hypothetical protein [Taibaiella koreensis]|uniref:hypothetical protein n=1 Tax=Taibaiella koreensis TaxID=1268548 RepID=UPI000E599FE1|nr:hypothetical protein [Taibaiella koreensis]
MARKYSRKHVSSLKDLDLEQERIKLKMRRLEDDVLGIMNPQQLAISVIGGWLKRRSRKSSAAASYVAGKPEGKARNKSEKAKKGLAGLWAKPAVKHTAKMVGVSFLRWQVFNLAWFLGKKLYQRIKQKRTPVARLSGQAG